MLASEDIAGAISQGRDPVWEPLIELIGPELPEWFMWMFELRLADGSRVHAYKHVATRRYFHLAEDGRAFLFTAAGDYREINRCDAIDEAFRGWERLLPRPDEPGALRSALRSARAAARLR